jgi:hypothetical protein
LYVKGVSCDSPEGGGKEEQAVAGCDSPEGGGKEELAVAGCDLPEGGGKEEPTYSIIQIQ